MRSYELTASTNQIGRATGRSSVAAASYRSASRMVSERTGIIYDYTKKGGVEHTEIYLPENAPEWASNREQLWNKVEVKENRKNSTLAHEVVIGFPAEFNIFQRREAGRNIANERVKRSNCPVDIAYHKPSRDGDNRNYHAHMMFTTRGLDSSTKDGWAKKKYRDLSSDLIRVNGKTTTRGTQELKSFRAFIADEMNRISERDGLEVKTEHLSFKERGIGREASQHLGHVASDMERKGKQSDRGDINREIKASNDNRSKLYEQKNILLLKHKREMLALEKAIELQEQQEKKETTDSHFKQQATVANENKEQSEEKQTEQETGGNDQEFIQPEDQSPYAETLDQIQANEYKENRQRDQLEQQLRQIYKRKETEQALMAARENVANSNNLWGRSTGKHQSALEEVEAYQKNLGSITHRETEMRQSLEQELKANRERPAEQPEKKSPAPLQKYQNFNDMRANAEKRIKENKKPEHKQATPAKNQGINHDR